MVKKNINTIASLDKNFLSKNDIKILALDFDGVLNAHGKKTVSAKAEKWLKSIIKKNKTIKIFILTNKPTEQRQKYFAKHFPEIKLLVSPKKKPYPDGLEKIMNYSNEVGETFKKNDLEKNIVDVKFEEKSDINRNSNDDFYNKEKLFAKKENLLLIDDRLATGMLAVEIFQCKGILILKPEKNILRNPIIEIFFVVLRFLERFFVKII